MAVNTFYFIFLTFRMAKNECQSRGTFPLNSEEDLSKKHIGEWNKTASHQIITDIHNETLQNLEEKHLIQRSKTKGEQNSNQFKPYDDDIIVSKQNSQIANHHAVYFCNEHTRKDAQEDSSSSGSCQTEENSSFLHSQDIPAKNGKCIYKPSIYCDKRLKVVLCYVVIITVVLGILIAGFCIYHFFTRQSVNNLKNNPHKSRIVHYSSKETVTLQINWDILDLTKPYISWKLHPCKFLRINSSTVQVKEEGLYFLNAIFNLDTANLNDLNNETERFQSLFCLHAGTREVCQRNISPRYTATTLTLYLSTILHTNETINCTAIGKYFLYKNNAMNYLEITKFPLR